MILPLRKGTAMPYLWIFLGCYAATLVTTLFVLMSRTENIVRAMQMQGLPDVALDQIRAEMLPQTCIVAFWCTIFAGSILGAISSVIFWVSQ